MPLGPVASPGVAVPSMFRVDPWPVFWLDRAAVARILLVEFCLTIAVPLVLRSELDPELEDASGEGFATVPVQLELVEVMIMSVQLELKAEVAVVMPPSPEVLGTDMAEEWEASGMTMVLTVVWVTVVVLYDSSDVE